MKTYRISKCSFIDDISGKGAADYGGRWNSKGTYLLYTSATASLALLESVVHISAIPEQGFCMATLDVPENSIREINVAELPAGWYQNPPASALKMIGDGFIQKGDALLLKVPSALIPEEFNYLINPRHSLFKKIKLVVKRKLLIDERLKKK